MNFLRKKIKPFLKISIKKFSITANEKYDQPQLSHLVPFYSIKKEHPNNF